MLEIILKQKGEITNTGPAASYDQLQITEIDSIYHFAKLTLFTKGWSKFNRLMTSS